MNNLVDIKNCVVIFSILFSLVFLSGCTIFNKKVGSSQPAIANTECEVIQKIYNPMRYGDNIQTCGAGYYIWMSGIEGGGEGYYFDKDGNEIGSKIVKEGQFYPESSTEVDGKIFPTEDDCKPIDITTCNLIDLYSELQNPESEYNINCEAALEKIGLERMPVLSTENPTPEESDLYTEKGNRIYYERKLYHVCTDNQTINFLKFDTDKIYGSEEEIFKNYKSITVYDLHGKVVAKVPKSNTEILVSSDALYKVLLDAPYFKKDFVSCIRIENSEECLGEG